MPSSKYFGLRRLEQLFFVVGVEGAERRGAGERVAGVGVAVEELHARARRAHEGLVDAVAHQHAAERHRARGDALGEGDEVGLDAEVLRGERSRPGVPSR